jgi:hypothetical protein
MHLPICLAISLYSDKLSDGTGRVAAVPAYSGATIFMSVPSVLLTVSTGTESQ